jgi:hypothetical protein
MSARPGGVTVIAILFIILAALGIAGSVVLIISTASYISQEAALNGIIFYSSLMMYGLPFDPVGFFLVINTTISFGQGILDVDYVVLGISVIIAALYVVTSYGLFRMKNWGRVLALVWGVLMIIGGAIGLLVIVGIIPLIFGIIVVVYLTRDVKHEFE